MQAGHTVLILDLDLQASAAKWEDRRENEPPVVISTRASRLKNALEAAEESVGGNSDSRLLTDRRLPNLD